MARGFGPSVLSNVHVLVVDDDEDVRDMTSELLGLCGARVTTAASGNAAWRAFEATSFDLVISDIGMRDGDGYELVRRIRSLPAERGGLVPAIAISGEGKAADSYAAGFHAHLVKPTDPLGLIDVIRGFVHEDHETRAVWTLATSVPEVALLTFVGHPTSNDMRSATRALRAVLERGPRRVVVDLRQITGFDPAVGSIAERTVWTVRHHITDATIVGGSVLARLVARAACAVLGVSCTLVDEWPARAATAS